MSIADYLSDRTATIINSAVRGGLADAYSAPAPVSQGTNVTYGQAVGSMRDDVTGAPFSSPETGTPSLGSLKDALGLTSSSSTGTRGSEYGTIGTALGYTGMLGPIGIAAGPIGAAIGTVEDVLDINSANQAMGLRGVNPGEALGLFGAAMLPGNSGDWIARQLGFTGMTPQSITMDAWGDAGAARELGRTGSLTGGDWLANALNNGNLYAAEYGMDQGADIGFSGGDRSLDAPGGY